MPRASRDRWLYPMFCALCALLLATTALAVIALVQNGQQGRDIQKFKDSTSDNCRRSLVFGPAIARAYGKYDILTPVQLAAYKASLPTSCP